MAREGSRRGSSLSMRRLRAVGLGAVSTHVEADLLDGELVDGPCRASGGRRRSRRCGSEMANSSSRSCEMIRMAVPLWASDSRNLWMVAAAPASTPQVGCAAISTEGACSISRPMMNFCRLPPERLRAALSTPGVRTSKSATTLPAKPLALGTPMKPKLPRLHAHIGRQHRVLPQRHVGHRAVAQPLLRHEAHAERAPRGWGRAGRRACRRSRWLRASPRAARRSAPPSARSGRCRRRRRCRGSRRP